MKVLYDHQAFTGVKFGGISRYFYYLMNYYKDRTDIDFDLSLKYSNNFYLKNQPFAKHLSYDLLSDSKYANRGFSLLNRLNSKKIISRQDFDIFHPTFYHRYFLDIVGNKPVVLTFHDVTTEKFHEQYPEIGGDMKDLKQTLLDRADKVIAVSENTRQDILQYFAVDEKKIKVIHLGTPDIHQNPLKDLQIALPEKFILYVGSRDAFKNFAFFLKAASVVLKKHKDLKILCAGAGAFSETETTMINDLGLSGRIMHIKAQKDAILYSVYQKALVFVYPSLYEGFGIPVLEAFACACPALLSNAGSLPEVGGEAALYFDPAREEELIAQLEKVVEDEQLNKKMKEDGLERGKLFSWEKTSLQTLEVYKSLM
ncbi:Glycosyltransferase involved in cell wall bisynthesis [Pseudarcicella hirudinis]|uniref:Glycosyltransferase involved in cell wall bisynthesis n=2 Tax=Pseudarcicella hirudinis TaxID=1079859 RepID=A0A1I5Y772_9BACT|nr:glycosyltransferase family 1 protein [Pseudarcicella hirudinis]SFQ39960.1 Glycosyltransferase involved in cell wall bisynthesis [Pseudarcicella hirudinis]